MSTVISLTAPEWDLYLTVDGVEEAAVALSAAATEAIAMADGDSGWEHFRHVAEGLRRFGAADSQPMNVFDDVARAARGEEW